MPSSLHPSSRLSLWTPFQSERLSAMNQTLDDSDGDSNSSSSSDRDEYPQVPATTAEASTSSTRSLVRSRRAATKNSTHARDTADSLSSAMNAQLALEASRKVDWGALSATTLYSVDALPTSFSELYQAASHSPPNTPVTLPNLNIPSAPTRELLESSVSRASSGPVRPYSRRFTTASSLSSADSLAPPKGPVIIQFLSSNVHGKMTSVGRVAQWSTGPVPGILGRLNATLVFICGTSHETAAEFCDAYEKRNPLPGRLLADPLRSSYKALDFKRGRRVAAPPSGPLGALTNAMSTPSPSTSVVSDRTLTGDTPPPPKRRWGSKNRRTKTLSTGSLRRASRRGAEPDSETSTPGFPRGSSGIDVDSSVYQQLGGVVVVSRSENNAHYRPTLLFCHKDVSASLTFKLDSVLRAAGYRGPPVNVDITAALEQYHGENSVEKETNSFARLADPQVGITARRKAKSKSNATYRAFQEDSGEPVFA